MQFKVKQASLQATWKRIDWVFLHHNWQAHFITNISKICENSKSFMWQRYTNFLWWLDLTCTARIVRINAYTQSS